MIKRDLDSCILQAGNYEQFLELLSDKGYEVKQGKYLAVKPQGMTRFRRCKTLGDMYSDEVIRERIEKEDISFYREQQKEVQPVLCKCKVRRYRNEKSHTIEGDRVNSAIDGLIEKVGMFAMEKKAISVDQVKENFSINGEQAESVIRQLETIGVLGSKNEDGTHA